MVTMPSTIVDIKVNVGDKISKGTSVLVVEAMKMETEITAPISGIVKKIFCQKGDVVNPKEILMTIEAHG
jgi:pyruvate carboxylase subunit B